jgi:hypothetical protein
VSWRKKECVCAQENGRKTLMEWEAGSDEKWLSETKSDNKPPLKMHLKCPKCRLF